MFQNGLTKPTFNRYLIPRSCYTTKNNSKKKFGYLGLTQEKSPSSSEKIQLKKVFDIFDKDKDGYISPSDLRRTMEAYGKTKTNEELTDMIENARKKAQKLHSLNFDQFEHHLLSLNELEETNSFTETARLLYLNEDFPSRMLHLRAKAVSNFFVK